MRLFGRNEFKPDRFGKSLFSRLYIPKRRRESLLRWALYAAVLVVLSLVQDVVMCRFRIAGATTDLVCAGIFLLGMMLPCETCAVFTLTASTVFCFSGMAPGPYSILFITVLCVLLNIFRVSFLRDSAGSTLFLAAAGLMVYELLTFITGLFLGLTTPARFVIFCISGAISLPVMPLLMPLFLAIGNIGGTSWND